MKQALHRSLPLAAAHRAVNGFGVALAAAGAMVLTPEAQAQALVADSIVAAMSQGRAAQWTLTPEVSSIRTRLAPTGASTLSPDGGTAELAGVDYRLWLSRGAAGVGVGVGTLAYVSPTPEGHADGSLAWSGTAPTVSVGMRYRTSVRSAVYADASGALGLPPDPAIGYLNTKIGVEWQPAKSRFGFDRGRIGIQLDSGYKLSFRLRRGGVGVYLRGEF